MLDNVEQVTALVQEDSRITDTADKLDISCRSAYSINYKDLGYHKICTRWVSKQFIDENKWAHMET